MNQRANECTINRAMVVFWFKAKREWDSLAKRCQALKRYDERDFYRTLAHKASSQVAYVSEELEKTSEKTMKVGTHGSTMNINSRRLITVKGQKVQLP